MEPGGMLIAKWYRGSAPSLAGVKRMIECVRRISMPPSPA